MVATKVARFGGVVCVIGVILSIPSFIGLAIAALFFISTIIGTANVMPNYWKHYRGKRSETASRFESLTSVDGKSRVFKTSRVTKLILLKICLVSNADSERDFLIAGPANAVRVW